MVHQLDRHEINAVKPLFNAPELSFMIDTLIAGNGRGDIWVDDPVQPKAACLWDRTCKYYLAGDHQNLDFNSEIGRTIEKQHKASTYLVAYCDSEAWVDVLPKLFIERSIDRAGRSFYKLNKPLVPNWREQIPAGFSVVRIDRELLSNTKLANLDGLIGEIECMWPSTELFLSRGLGFCAIHSEKEIAGWCTAEHVSENQLGIGIETVETFQEKGLATLTASALVEECYSRQITAYWDCWARNTASLRVAEKVGFVKMLDYDVYVAVLND